DGSGEIVLSGNQFSLLDVGSPGYEQRFVDNVKKNLAGNGPFDGVFLDDVYSVLGSATGGRYPPQYPNDAAWEAAMERFMDAVGPPLRAAGVFVVARGYASGDPIKNAAWFTRLAPDVDALSYSDWELSTDSITVFD